MFQQRQTKPFAVLARPVRGGLWGNCPHEADSAVSPAASALKKMPTSLLSSQLRRRLCGNVYTSFTSYPFLLNIWKSIYSFQVYSGTVFFLYLLCEALTFEGTADHFPRLLLCFQITQSQSGAPTISDHILGWPKCNVVWPKCSITPYGKPEQIILAVSLLN